MLISNADHRKAQRASKTRQGLFFFSLTLGATVVVLLMLASLLGYMLYRGCSRIFYSPTYLITFTDGSQHLTDLNENLEFDCIGENDQVVPRSAIQASKFYLNTKLEEFKYTKAPIPLGTVVEVWVDVETEVEDPWASKGEQTATIKQIVQKKQGVYENAVEVHCVPERRECTLTFKDGTNKILSSKLNLQFRQGDDLINLRTLVTRYLQAHPDELKKREADGMTVLGAKDTFPMDVRYKAYVTAHISQENDGIRYLREQRVRELPPMKSFIIVDRWNWFQFFWDFPRSGNTEGGILPCIFGTVMMTLIMTLMVAPFGVATAVYLMEYARENWFTRVIRLAVANLAGIPSIVFGLFGLGFFVLTIGGGIDRAFYDGNKVFGTPCVLWASLTMALLTLPVMIVATEEALRTVPREMREGALALGATKLSTILTIVLPTALPGILTGVILSVSRGAGEVAPLLLTGVIAHKDQLPLNPLEKFMDLAYHIYDLSVKSQPNKIEEAQSLAFSSAFVLILVILSMNILAILLRSRLSRIKIR